MKLHKILFFILLFLIPIQTRILYMPGEAYVSWYFNYHLAIFLYITDILIVAILGTWLTFDRPAANKLIENRLYLLTLGLIGLILVTLFHVKRLDLGVYSALKWIELLLLLLYIRFEVKSRTDFQWVILIVFMSSVLQAILGWVQFHMQHMVGLRFLGEYVSNVGTAGLATIDTATGKIIRGYGTLPHPNVLAAFLVSGMASGLHFVSHETKWIKFASALGVIVIIIGQFATFSRIGWVASVLIMLGFAIYSLFKKKYITLLIISVVAIVSCATIFALYSDKLAARVTNSSAVSIDDRYFFNQMGIDMIKKFPSLGVGVGNYVVAEQDLFILEPWQYQPPHNIYLFIAAELGLIGLGLFILIIIEIINKFRAGEVLLDPMLFTFYLLLFTFLLMGQFDHYFVTIQQGRLLFIIVLGLIAALPNLHDYQRSN